MTGAPEIALEEQGRARVRHPAEDLLRGLPEPCTPGVKGQRHPGDVGQRGEDARPGRRLVAEDLSEATSNVEAHGTVSP